MSFSSSSSNGQSTTMSLLPGYAIAPVMQTLPVRTKITDGNDLARILASENPGIILIKLGATWCGPCKTIEPYIRFYAPRMPVSVQSFVIDIDECPQFYGYLQTRKMVKGVPALLAYYAGNVSYIPDDVVVGANVQQVQSFYERHLIMGNKLLASNTSN